MNTEFQSVFILFSKGESIMAKIFGFTPLELRSGVNGEDFEKFFNNEFALFGHKLGWKAYVLKADRGERVGKYAVIWELPSIELRNRQIPGPDQITEEVLQLLGPEWDEANKKLDTFVVGWPSTDYVEMV